jgi:hypothetical protein
MQEGVTLTTYLPVKGGQRQTSGPNILLPGSRPLDATELQRSLDELALAQEEPLQP